MLRQSDSSLMIMMRNTHLLPLLCLALFPGGARAQGLIQNMDIFFLFGPAKVNSQTVPGTTVTAPGSSGYSEGTGYGYQIARKSAASLWIEFIPAFYNSGTGNAGSLGSVDWDWTAFMLGIRVMVPVQSRISVYGAAGGGFGGFRRPVITGTSPLAVGSSGTDHGVFDFGGGIDFRLQRFISVRAELRDYVTSSGLSGPTGHHHLMPVAGLAFHF